MNNGAFGERFPYTNFHDLNMDWILQVIKEFEDDYTGINTTLTEAINQIIAKGNEETGVLENFTEDKLTELNNWYETHSDEISDELADAIARLNERATEIENSFPSDYVQLSDDIRLFNSHNILTNTNNVNTTINGITWTKETDGRYKAVGTATADSVFNIYAQANILLPELSAGDVITLDIERTDENIEYEYFEYINGGYINSPIYSYPFQKVMSNNATGQLIRLCVKSGRTVNGYMKPFIYKTNSDKDVNSVIPVIRASETYNQTTMITKYLTDYGVVYLEAGLHLVDNLIMPNNSTIRGTGKKSKIQTTATGHSAITAGQNCMIEDVYITGEDVPAQTSALATTWGIKASTESVRQLKLVNVEVANFSGAGLLVEQTGYDPINSLEVVNCHFRSAYWGIKLGQYAEYSCFTNCKVMQCKIGVLCNGGNNRFVNCGFTDNGTGFYIDEDNATANGGHGCLVGCAINHSGNNTGYAFILRNIINGFVFSGCNIWYGKIIATDCNGIILSDSVFGGGTPYIEHWTNGLFLVSNCAFKETPTLEGSGDNFIMRNCFTFDGSSVGS